MTRPAPSQEVNGLPWWMFLAFGHWPGTMHFYGCSFDTLPRGGYVVHDNMPTVYGAGRRGEVG